MHFGHVWTRLDTLKCLGLNVVFFWTRLDTFGHGRASEDRVNIMLTLRMKTKLCVAQHDLSYSLCDEIGHVSS